MTMRDKIRNANEDPYKYRNLSTENRGSLWLAKMAKLEAAR